MMKLDVMKKLIEKLPEGAKKQALLAKVNAATAQGKKSKGGLNDTFEFKPKGHIRIETIDAGGHVTGLLADQANLVVNGAEEILLRSFSGDPDQMLYKVQIPKGGVSPKYHVGLSDTISSTVDDVDQLNFAPNIFWNVVDDNDFDVFYSYRPHTLFLKEEEADASQVGKKAFTIRTKADVAGCIPISSAIHSTHTNLFIGLGDGENYAVGFQDTRLGFSEGWSGQEKKETSTLNDAISFKQKISNFVLKFEKSNAGGQLAVYINGVLKETIETFDSNLTAPVVVAKEFKELNNENETEVRIVFSGSDAAVSNPKVVINEIRFDALSKDMNALIHEFDTFTKEFSTQTAYSTTTTAPYTVQFEHFPIVADSLELEYNNVKLRQVDALEEVVEGTYFLDARYGKAYFSRTLSGILAKFKVTGEIYETRQVGKLADASVAQDVKNEAAAGVVDGENRIFTLAQNNVVRGSVVVTKTDTDGQAEVVPVANYSVNEASKTITFNSGKQPVAGESIAFDYKVNVAAKKIKLQYTPGELEVLEYGTGIKLTKVESSKDFGNGKYFVDAENKEIIVSSATGEGKEMVSLEIFFTSEERPGVPTGYTRAVIEKPKSGIAYPWYQLDKGSVSFIAEFAENTPNSTVTIREMGLFDGPRADDKIEGFNNYPVDAFSLVRVGETRKEVSTGIRVTWTITLLNSETQPFTGGY